MRSEKKIKFFIIIGFYFFVIFIIFGIKQIKNLQAEKIFSEIKEEINFKDKMMSSSHNNNFIKYYIYKFRTPVIKKKVARYLKIMPNNLDNNFYLFCEGLFSPEKPYDYFFYKAIENDDDIFVDKFYRKLFSISFSENLLCLKYRRYNKNSKLFKINFNDRELIKKEFKYFKEADIYYFSQIAFDYNKYMEEYPYNAEREYGRVISLIFIHNAIYDILVNFNSDILRSLKIIAFFFNHNNFNFRDHFDFQFFFNKYSGTLQLIKESIDKKSKAYKLIEEEIKKFENYKIKDMSEYEFNSKEYLYYNYLYYGIP